MTATTREREPLRVPARGPTPRGPYRADPGPARTAEPQERPGAQTLHAAPAPPRPMPVRSPSAPATRPRQAPSIQRRERPTTKLATTKRPAKPGVVRDASVIRHAAVAAGPRMRFAVLVLALLGGGLVCLLVINTTLGATSFRISQLQSANASLTSQEQALQQQIAAERSPAQIARRAYQLGMRAEPNTTILDLRSHRIDKLPAQPDAVVQLGGSGTPGGSRP